MHALPALQGRNASRAGRGIEACAPDARRRATGDQEDKQGRPFVGPAGRILEQALDDAGIVRGDVFITNAVKHFKFEQRGKRRLHKRPNAYEIERCRWWLDIERALIKPGIVVALGATALRSVSGKSVAIKKIRGRLTALPDGGRMLATIHPSYILRIRDDADKAAQYRQFVADLKLSRRELGKSG